LMGRLRMPLTGLLMERFHPEPPHQ
jgi:hypothetical protein